MLIRGSTAFLEDRFVKDIDVRIEKGKVTEVGSHLLPREGENIVSAKGDWLIPGFVDVHTHGAGGFDTMRGEADIRAMARLYRSLGVSAFLPTTMSAGMQDTAAVLEAVGRVMDAPEAEESLVLGAHMEAPFLSPAKAGAQVKEHFRLPSMELLRELTAGRCSRVRMITMAPELEGSEAFIRSARLAGITVSAGHTSATAEELHRAGDWGCNHVTHTFNAQTPLQHRAPGVPGAALVDDRFYCEMICDGVHLHPDTIRLLVKCKGWEKAVMITDSMEAAAMPDGDYSLGGQQVTVKGSEARLADGTLAGSVLTMPRAFKNMILRFGFAPEQVIPMCTSVPALSIGEKLAGTIQPGAPAPLTLWSEDWQTMEVLDDILA